MGRFLALFNGAADEGTKVELTEGQQIAFIEAWAHGNEGALVDPGAPLNAKKFTTAGLTDPAC
ncbi:hypothetical protein [Paractinoplanes maris]|uniref:hypothetical protein n=1 Tax=Paractinoplanes maris TaxID=1734446 RepID=UPI002021ECB9|nr:hypothetical protein [Actinoplanes maris]